MTEMKINKQLIIIPGINSPGLISSNTYVILDDRVTIVDPGHQQNLNNLVSSLENNGLSVRDIDFILNTHTHSDHCGANYELQLLTKAKIALHELDEDFLPLSNEIARRFGDEIPFFNVDIHLQDSFRTGKYEFTILHTPGHTPGGVCFYDQLTKVLISGDTVFPRGNIGRTDFPGGSVDELARSVERLAGLDIEILCPGHMEIAKNGVKEQLQASLGFARSLCSRQKS